MRYYLNDYGYRVHEIRISQKFLHLDDGLGTACKGLAIVCRDQSTYGPPDLIWVWAHPDMYCALLSHLLGLPQSWDRVL